MSYTVPKIFIVLTSIYAMTQTVGAQQNLMTQEGNESLASVQLYLHVEKFQTRGILDEKPAPDGQVYFRECNSNESRLVKEENLLPVTGDCNAGGIWVGVVKKIQNGDIHIATMKGDVFDVTEKEWAKAFQSPLNQDVLYLTAEPGALVGGWEADPSTLFAIDPRKLPNSDEFEG